MPETPTVKSPEPPAPREPQVTMDEASRLARKRELMGKIQQTFIANLTQGGRIIKGDPNKRYCWVKNNNERQLAFKLLGWVRCLSPTPEDLPHTDHRQDDGLHVRGDTVLYEMPTDYHEALEAWKELRRLNTVVDAENSWKDTAARHGVKTYTPKY